ncbi:MAG TPA: radical SAM protein [Elusimicrobiota bacterium]|nr:radical SAM protein [Elusimicrobiota bacterium]
MDTIKPNRQRKDFPPYKRFFTWDIHHACNYRCSYCFFHETWGDEEKKNVYPGLDRLMRIWDDIYDKYGESHVHVSGGEPFFYPGFIDLVAHLIQKHTFEVDTNLSFDVAEWIRRIPPERTKLDVTFHPQFADLDEFYSKAKALKDAHYDIGVNYVAFPEQLSQMKQFRQVFVENGLSFDIMPFRGKYQGRDYPQGYTDSEKEMIRQCDPRTASRMLSAFDQKKTPESLNPHAGKLCRMGQMYAKIMPDGTVSRCCHHRHSPLIGNLLDGTFVFYEEAKTCPETQCSCWIPMVVEQEKNWNSHWISPNERKKR